LAALFLRPTSARPPTTSPGIGRTPVQATFGTCPLAKPAGLANPAATGLAGPRQTLRTALERAGELDGQHASDVGPRASSQHPSREPGRRDLMTARRLAVQHLHRPAAAGAAQLPVSGTVAARTPGPK